MTSAQMLDCLAVFMGELRRKGYTGPVTVETDDGTLTVHVCRGEPKRAVLLTSEALAFDKRHGFAQDTP